MIPADMTPLIEENIRARQAFCAALLSLDGTTPAQLTAQYPNADMATLTSDPDFMHQVERFAGMPAVQEYALDAQLRRGLAESVTGLVAKIQAPDASGAALGAASDALTKISNLMDRRAAAKQDGGTQGLCRHLHRTFGGKVTITTIEGVTEFTLIARLAYEQNLAAVRAMRCTGLTEVAQVLKALHSGEPVAVLTLHGF